MKKQDIPMVVSGLLLGSALLLDAMGMTSLRDGSLAIASLIALLPIGRKAVGALRFGMASIELLVTIAVVGALFLGEFSEAAIVSFLFLFGAFLESRTIRKTRSAMESLIKLAPSSAVVLRDGRRETVDILTLVEGDIVEVRTGQRIPVDGTIVHGSATIDQSQITGESMPSEKTIGDSVYASTILQNGYAEIMTKRVGESTVFGNILKRLEEAQDKKAQTQRVIEKFAGWYTPSVVVLAIVTYLISRDIRLALTLLVIACPGAMVISIPVAIVAGIGTMAKHGILVKGGESIEKLAKINVIAFDKTGTLTIGKPKVSMIHPVEGDESSILNYASIAEHGSSHALAKAILAKAEEMGIKPSNIASNLDVLAGYGVVAVGDFGKIIVGNLRLAKQNETEFPIEQLDSYSTLTQTYPTCVFVLLNGKLLGYLILSDTLRDDTQETLVSLRKLGVQEIHVITGDSAASASQTLGPLGIDRIHADILPQEKADIILKLKKRKKVAMVGDGINDTLALNESDAGIAMSSDASEVAMKTADIVILGEKVESVATAMRIARFTSKVLKQNIVISIGTVFFLIFGVLLGKVHMDTGMLVHEASVLAVILNALRILRKK
ncbi:MAG: hypothetical protein A2Y20_03600 [Firmicutes bacterium GWF2_51_9]|nr:cation-translocating P-type ATPase [Erysipelotrichaceae bacterium]OGS53824.1 MAG: hypothetical protein A2Y20_03600 [Firmicutes bacterium GWF2_51_9]OGS57878.1 MAG: hypothetical protein A2Y19_10400 [Firmicutes bacterium GWE2_51_13]HAM63912.1 heavy metal translocating P-type ATPase [Erysipelotrichaceae bacterium]HBZ41341.1 heavy metal translocating P-type ATPase [Erysipelotrichaceae bacterium]